MRREVTEEAFIGGWCRGTKKLLDGGRRVQRDERGLKKGKEVQKMMGDYKDGV